MAADVLPPGIDTRDVLLFDTDEVPWNVREAIRDGYTFVAHNALGFDALAYARLVGGPQPAWYDTVPCARAAGLPGKLDDIGERLTGSGKDAIGSKVMKMLATAKHNHRAGGVEYPIGTDAAWNLLLRYNVVDVLLLERVFHETQDYGEADVLQVDSVVNNRGVAVDTELADMLSAAWGHAQKEACDEVSRLTHGRIDARNIRSVPQVQEWVTEQGINLTSLDKNQVKRLIDTPEELVEDADNPLLASVVEVLSLRQVATSAAAGKLAGLRDSLREGRARDMLVYYGAHTGRWSGRGFQPQNLGRGSKRVPVEECLAALDTLRLDDVIGTSGDEVAASIRRTCPSVPLRDSLSTLTRPVFYAPEGKSLLICDYAAIEARGVAWVAGDNAALEVFRTGRDPYCEIASLVFGRPVAKKDEVERSVGKVLELGCLAEDTPVLTARGEVPIQDVRSDDLVWDGCEWVSHEGVIFQGVKECVNLNGVLLTLDHQVLTNRGWYSAADARRGDVAFHAGSEPQARRDESTTESEYRTHNSADSWRLHGESFFDVTIQKPQTTPGTGGEESLSSMNGAATLGSSFDTSRRLTTADRLIGSTTAATMNPETFDSRLDPSKQGTHVRRDLSRFVASQCRLRISSNDSPNLITTPRVGECFMDGRLTGSLRRVYDLVNAGPRHRFQAGSMIVSNCGYGMSGNKFSIYAKQSGIDLESLGLSAATCIKAYREKHAPIKKLWYALGDAALQVVSSGDVCEVGRCRLAMRGQHFVITLPSGRDIVYRNARVEMLVPVYCKMLGLPEVAKPTVVYEHPRGYVKGIYGGLICENVVQAICRDLLAVALVRCEQARLDTVLHVHDEIVCEVEIETAETRLAELVKIMTAAPPWAEGFPVAVEGFVSPRYVKSPFKGYVVLKGESK